MSKKIKRKKAPDYLIRCKLTNNSIGVAYRHKTGPGITIVFDDISDMVNGQFRAIAAPTTA